MLSDRLQDALNEQMKNEFFSAYLYMAMAGYFQSEDLPGFATWMRVQALEEMTHGEKFFHFICDANGRTDVRPIEGPQTSYKSPLECFKADAVVRESLPAHVVERFIAAKTDEWQEYIATVGNWEIDRYLDF